MKKTLLVKDIKKLERLEFKRRGSSFSLMNEAGTKCAKESIKLIRKKKAIIVCGPGNNGGDGFIIAAFLKKKNYDVDVFSYPKKIYSGDALLAMKKLNFNVKNIKNFRIKKNSLIIDCLFGTGLSRNISSFLKKIILKINKSKQYVVSIDIPSGINSDSGKIMECAIKANTTLVLHAKKFGHILHPGKKFCGEIKVLNIGILEK